MSHLIAPIPYRHCYPHFTDQKAETYRGWDSLNALLSLCLSGLEFRSASSMLSRAWGSCTRIANCLPHLHNISCMSLPSSLYHQRALLASVAFRGLCSILWSSPVKYKGRYLDEAGWWQIFIKHQHMFNTLPLVLEAWRNIKNVSFHEDFTIWDEETTEQVKHQWSIS